MRLFEFKDKNGKIVYLTKERWSHINIEHPEIASYVEEFKEVLNNPTKIVDYPHDKNIKYYHKHFKNRKEKSKYLLMIVKYLNDEGFIITAYFVRNIK